jgi:hypothetical protein
MASEERNNTLTIGGILLQRDSGGFTIANPIAQYGNVRDDQVQEFWHWLARNQKMQQAMAQFQDTVASELMAWGDSRGLQPSQMAPPPQGPYQR